jgi:hypothetical protein
MIQYATKGFAASSVVLAVLLLALSVGAAAYLSHIRKPLSEVPIASAAPTSWPQPPRPLQASGDTAWPTYRNDTYGFSIQNPPVATLTKPTSPTLESKVSDVIIDFNCIDEECSTQQADPRAANDVDIVGFGNGVNVNSLLKSDESEAQGCLVDKAKIGNAVATELTSCLVEKSSFY